MAWLVAGMAAAGVLIAAYVVHLWRAHLRVRRELDELGASGEDAG